MPHPTEHTTTTTTWQPHKLSPRTAHNEHLSNNTTDNHGHPKANATPPETTASQEQYPLDEEGGDLARALELSYEDVANNRKRQGKKRAHARQH